MLQTCRYGEQIDGLKDLINDLPSGIVMAEIGCWRGESADIFLSSGKVKKFYAVDIWRAKNCDLAEKEFDQRIGKRAVKLKMPMREALKYIKEKLDFIYIDGSHTYQAVKEDIYYSKRIIKVGGIIGGHDYCDKYKDRVVRAVDEFLGKPDKKYKDSSWIKRL